MLKPGAQVSAAELIAHCKGHLGVFEVPKDVVFLAALPLSPTGKIQKFDLRREHLGHYGLA
jgi:long-chain acyl-CoA synthetase